MKLLHFLFVLIFRILASKSLGDDSSEHHEETPDIGHGDVVTHSAQWIGDAIHYLLEDLSHMTSLHESFVHHPLISRFHTNMDEPFSSWDPFSSIKRWSPRYELINNAKNFQVKLDVPGFHFHEISVELEAGGRLLSISGRKEDNVHESFKLDHDYETKTAMGEKDKVDEENGKKSGFFSHTITSFEQKFPLDPSIDTTLMTANLVNGVLEVRAPRKSIPRINRHIPVTQFDLDVWAELISSDDADPTQETSKVLKTE
jgi:HSP20 family molecular chaperone IbpA